jgi:RNA polymerase sigma-70 factor (ECF subfamily)
MVNADIRFQIVALLPRLRLFAYTLTRAADDSDDLVQSTCERALKSIDSWQPGTRLDSWMFRIMRNLWIDRLRRKRAEGNVIPLDEESDLPGNDGRRYTEGRLELAAVHDAILALPEDQRSVLVLVCIEELSYRDAAAALDVPIGTVMSRLARARKKISEIIAANPRTAAPKSMGGGS